MDLKLELAGSDITNSYPLWVYPAGGELSAGDVIIASSLSDDVTKALRDGARVASAPSRSIVDSTTVGGLFMTDYWNYRMFKTISESNNRPVSPEQWDCLSMRHIRTGSVPYRLPHLMAVVWNSKELLSTDT